MGERFRVLSAIDRTYAEGKKSCQNACNRGMRSSSGLRLQSGWRASSHEWLICRLRRLYTFQSLGEAVLAIDHAPYRAGTIRTQCLPTRATVRRGRDIGMIGAVHANLL